MLSTITSTLLIPTLPIIVHGNSSVQSNPSTQSDIKFIISVWIVFTIIGLLSATIEYVRFRRQKSKYDSGESFSKFLSDKDSFLGTVGIWSSVFVNIIYIIGVLVYVVYSIL